MIYIDGKPTTTLNTNGIFKMDEDVQIVKKGLTPIQRQRRLDGTPHTVTRPTALKPDEPKIYLEGLELKKSKDIKKNVPKIDPDAIIKAFLSL